MDQSKDLELRKLEVHLELARKRARAAADLVNHVAPALKHDAIKDAAKCQMEVQRIEQEIQSLREKP